MAKIVTGRVEVLVQGEPILNKEGAIARGISVSGRPAIERTPVLGDTGYHGSVEKAIMAECEVKITDREDIMLSDYADLNENATIIFRAYNGGKSYTMENASCTANLEVTAGEGETALKFYGPQWVESIQ